MGIEVKKGVKKMQISTNYVPNFKMNSKSQVSNPQFKSKTAVISKGFTKSVSGGKFIEASTRPLFSAIKYRLSYIPETDLANKSAKESAYIMNKLLTYRELPEILTMRDKDEKFLFSLDDINNIEKMYLKYPYAVNELAKMTTEDGKQRFNASDITNLAGIYAKEPDAIKGLAEMKIKQGEALFPAEEIKELVDKYKVYPKEIKELADFKIGKYRRFGSSGICNLAETCKLYPDALKGLVSGELENYYYYTDDDIINLAEPYSKYPKAVTELLKMRDNSESAVHERTHSFFKKNKFDSNDWVDAIPELAEPYSKHPDYVKGLIKMKDKGGEYRFDLESICAIANEYVKEPDFVKELVEMETPDKKFYRFDGKEICKLAKKGAEYRDAIKTLASIGSKNGFKYSYFSIERLLDICKEYPEEVIKLSEMKEKDTDFYLFIDLEVHALAPLYAKYPEFIDEIIKNSDHPNMDNIIKAVIKYEESLPKA